MQGDIKSQFELGNIYVNEVKDDVRVFEWFSKAAVQGSPTAQEYVARMYVMAKELPVF